MQQEVASIHNHTAAMLEMGTNLMEHRAEQTRRLKAAEAEVRPLPGLSP